MESELRGSLWNPPGALAGTRPPLLLRGREGGPVPQAQLSTLSGLCLRKGGPVQYSEASFCTWMGTWMGGLSSAVSSLSLDFSGFSFVILNKAGRVAGSGFQAGVSLGACK